MNSEQILDEVHMSYKHGISTRKIYKLAVKKYTTFCNMDLSELLDEAEAEEDKGIRWKRRSLKRRLISYRQYLVENYSLNTVKTMFQPILAIYKYYEIEILELPKLNPKQVKKSEPVQFKDLPDKEVLREVISVANVRMVAIILFMCSSGCARRETLNLKIKDYIAALGEYTDQTDIYEILNDLGDDDEIVPTWSIWRQKTDKYYTTYCSPEAVLAINKYLLTREDDLTPESALFQIDPAYLNHSFKDLNNLLGLGKVGCFVRFRPHMLRKFHASALYNNGMSMDNVNDLQGKAKNKTDSAYFMTNPEDLKYEYIKHLPAVTISKEIEKLSVKSPEFKKMEVENETLKTELGDMKRELGDIERIKQELAGIKEKVGD